MQINFFLHLHLSVPVPSMDKFVTNCITKGIQHKTLWNQTVSYSNQGGKTVTIFPQIFCHAGSIRRCLQLLQDGTSIRAITVSPSTSSQSHYKKSAGQCCRRTWVQQQGSYLLLCLRRSTRLQHCHILSTYACVLPHLSHSIPAANWGGTQYTPLPVWLLIDEDTVV